ncbi:hypothetical protein [Streptomyces sp. NBC_00083]|uniref:hypothetical protein n=1 Tax=Streptomyces sp. NBC_00083 TaxID=2975647 RepID=UPI00224E2A2F|nr:hypothetical protein [Streptomyces sp. NBC_00083]MCX5386269.1 hypothetical protein [Streptomyces sp. NBC_00083]
MLYDDIVGPTCEQLGFTLLRADKLAEAGLPAQQLLRMLSEVDVVVVDLSASDAELSFALGARHALGRCTVQVVAAADEFTSFEVATRVLLPSRSDDAAAVRQHLTDLLAAEMPSGEQHSASTSPSLERLGPQPTGGSVAGSDEDLPGVFDLIVEAEAQLGALSGDMADMESAMADLGEMMELIAEDMARVSHPGASMSMKMSVVSRLAKAIDGPTMDLEMSAQRFAERMGTNVGALRSFLEWTGSVPRSEWPEGAEEVLEQMVMAAWEVRGLPASFQEGVALINMLGAASRHLRRPARRITTSLQTLFRSVAVLEELQGIAAALKQS